MATGELVPYARNSRTHIPAQVKQVMASIREFGFTNPVLIDENRTIIAGHCRVMAAEKLGIDDVPTITLSGLSDAQRRAYVIVDNSLAENAGWNDEMLAAEIESLIEDDFDTGLLGLDDDRLDELLGDCEKDPYKEGESGALSDRFGIPPFSVIDTRRQWWRERKANWLDIGLNSGAGRDDVEVFNREFSKNHGGALSIFDPVLCEILYKWFVPHGGRVIDPFAGGSVRGVVASCLGLEYTGVDIRREQVDANIEQIDLCTGPEPEWICGDSANIGKMCDGTYDFVFSCPPYAYLEVYSDDPKDISNMGYGDFINAYSGIIKETCRLLNDDRFACFVVGEVRGKGGGYLNFVADTVQAFLDAGLEYYNEMILVTMEGSLPIRAENQFTNSRKIGKMHQNILVFVKGDPKKAALACGDPVESIKFYTDDEHEDL